MTFLYSVLALILGLSAGAAGAYGWLRRQLNTQAAQIEATARLQMEQIRAEQKDLLLQAREENQRLRDEAETELRANRALLQKQEDRLTRKEENLDRKLDTVEKRERQFVRSASASSTTPTRTPSGCAPSNKPSWSGLPPSISNRPAILSSPALNRNPAPRLPAASTRSKLLSRKTLIAWPANSLGWRSSAVHRTT